MEIPALITDRLARLSAECGTTLRVVSYWENEFRAGWYCRFRGIAIKSELIVIELAGTLAVELEQDRSDEVDLFIFVNGTRVSCWNPKSCSKYLWRRGAGSLAWDSQDDGYFQFETLENEVWKLDQPPLNSTDGQ